jgi:cytochrome c
MRGSYLIGLLAALLIAGCRAPLDESEVRGAVAIGRYGCGSCHTVKGIQGANGLVGPPLTGIGSRLYVAGMLENTPEHLAAWIHNPRAINPKTAMPNVGASQKDARDIAAYLKTR